MYTRQTTKWGGRGRRHDRRRIATMLATAVVGMCAFLTQSAHGNDAQRQAAEAFIRRGVELRQAGNDDAAAREFKKAYDLARTPRAAAQLGLAEQALGRWEDAEAHVSESLLAPRDPWIAKHQATLREALINIKDHVGRVEVIGEPEGAEVFVNGRSVGKAPVPEPVHVRAGEVHVELRAPGYVRASRNTMIRGGQYQSIVIRLEKERATPIPSARSAAQSAEATRAATPVAAAPPEETRSPSAPTSVAPSAPNIGDTGQPGDGARPHAIVKWTAVGLAIGALALGTTATFIRYDKKSAFDSEEPRCTVLNGRAVLEDTSMPAQDCQVLLDDFNSARKWQIVGFAGAGLFALTGLVLALTQPEGASATRHSAASLPALSRRPALLDWACTATTSNPGLSCQARF